MAPELSRADLLRVLARAPGVPAAPIARLLGWQSEEVAEPGAASATAPSGAAGAGPAAMPVRYLARPAPVYWHVAGCEPLAGDSGADRPEAPDTDSEAQPAQGPPPDPRIAPLLHAGQWQNLWDRLPPSRQSGRAIDLPASLRRLARAEPLRDLPRRPRRGFNRAVALILDRPAALRPVWDDMRLARRSLAALLGDELQAFHLPAGPDGPWLESAVPSPSDAGPGSSLTDTPDPGPDAIAAGALVVLIGAFGALESAEIAPDWQRLLARLRGGGHSLLLVPVCPLRQAGQPAVPLDPAIDRADREGADRALDMLLAALSQTWLPTPARLRQLRRAIPGADLHTELRAYNAPDVERDDFHLWLMPDQLGMWSNRFAERCLDPRGGLQRVIDVWRQGLDAWARAIECLQASLPAPGPPEQYAGLEALAAEVAAALDGPNTMARAQLASMLTVLDHVSDARWLTVQHHADQLRRLLGLGTLADPSAADAETPSHSLVQRGAGLVVRPGIEGLLPVGPRAYSLETGRLVDGAALTAQRTLTVIDRGYRWRLAPTARPRWAERIWSDGRHLYAAHGDKALFRWEPAAPGRSARGWQPEHNAWPWAAEIGVDGFGLWATLKVGGAPYRLRWIAPGTFLMGSPPDEPERQENEIQHEVMLSRGFWLGEIAVPQALWQAVMGGNPSTFKGDDLPVEGVRWDDCQRFVASLAGLAPGLAPRLPTEAEWEYACRAGTRSAFSFGDGLDTGQANYDGDYPYNGGPKGEYRRRTVPVHSFAPNPWGLYQMHGNVLEWCADWYGPYPAGPALDPSGPADGPGRVLRGGAWDYRGRDLRSAVRALSLPVFRSHDFGLRLAGGVGPQAGEAGAGAMTADGRERSDQPVGGHGGGTAVSRSSRPELPDQSGLIPDWLGRLSSPGRSKKP